MKRIVIGSGFVLGGSLTWSLMSFGAPIILGVGILIGSYGLGFAAIKALMG